MPINTNAIDAILSAFSTGKNIAGQQQQRQLDKERLDQQKELELKRLDAEHEYRQAEHEIQSKQFDLTKLIQEQNIMQKYGETGNLPSGATVQKPVVGVTGNPQQGFSNTSATPGLGLDEQRVSVPGFAPSVVQSPEAQAQRAGQLGLAREAPILEKQKQQQQEIADRNAQLEGLKAAAAEKLQLAKLESDLKRTGLMAEARKYAADKSFQARVQAAQITGGKLTGQQKTSFDNLTDIEDAIKNTKSSLDNTGWDKYFTNSAIDEAGRKIKGAPPELSDPEAKLNILQDTLAQHAKENATIKNILDKSSVNPSRWQNPDNAKDNLNTLLYQIQKEKTNIGSANKASGAPRVIKFDKNGNPIGN
jgi:hypothetical protein